MNLDSIDSIISFIELQLFVTSNNNKLYIQVQNSYKGIPQNDFKGKKLMETLIFLLQ